MKDTTRPRPDDKTVLTVWIDKELQHQFKMKAVENRESMSALIVGWIKKYLTQS